jgi:hypothetical protein
MIRFQPAPEPGGFAEQWRQPGAAWLALNPPPKRPRDFWTPFKPHSLEGLRKKAPLIARAVEKLNG